MLVCPRYWLACWGASQPFGGVCETGGFAACLAERLSLSAGHRGPPVLEMQFRGLARLQPELSAWEAIRDAELQYRSQPAEFEERKLRFEENREVGVTAPNLFETGLCT